LAHRGTYAATAYRDTSKYITSGYGTSERNHYIVVVILRVQLISTEIDQVMPGCVQLTEHLLF
jgi:hypothetical protein